MTIKKVEPGDVNIVRIELLKDNRSIDIRSQVVALSMFEDIEEPSMMLEIIMVDALNLVQDFPIVGEETVNISFYTPGRDNITRKGFIIYSVEGTSGSPTSKASAYTIKAVSPVHFINAVTEVNKTYKDTIDNVVTDILKNLVSNGQIKNTNISVEPTKGLTPFTFPSITPFEAIDLLRQRAISKEFLSGGSFVFFENQYGFQFKSVEKLLKDGKTDIKSKTFSYSPNTVSNVERQAYAFRNLLDYNHIGKFDSVDKMVSGALKSVVNSFDILTKNNSVIEFNLSEKAKDFTSSDKKGKLTNTTGFMEKYGSSTSKGFSTVKDSSKGDDYVDLNIGIKNSYSKLFNQNIVRGYIHGDSYLTVGDLIELNLPETSGTTERKNKDRLNSGNYLITKLRHIIIQEQGGKPKHKISFDSVKMGYK